MQRDHVVERLLEAFDGQMGPEEYMSFLEQYDPVRNTIRFNIKELLGSSKNPVTKGRLWTLRDLLDDVQSLMIGDGMDDPDLDARFANMRKCIDSELSVEAPPSPSVAEIWSRRFHALLDFCLRRKQPEQV